MPDGNPTTIESLSLPILYQNLADAQLEVKAQSGLISAIGAEIDRRFTGNVLAAYRAAGKEYGTVKGALHDGFTFKADISKRVKWDQPKMKALAATLVWSQVEHLFDITFKVKETIYKAMMPGPITDSLTDARTVTYGDPKIELVAAE